MPLHQRLQLCVLLISVFVSFGLTPRESNAACIDPKLSPGDIVKKSGDNVKEYVVQTCLGKGDHGEMWTLNGSDHLLKFGAPLRGVKISSECLFGRIAAQKDPAHFANCFDHGSGEVWSLEGSDLVLKYEWRGDYTVWQRVDGQRVSVLLAPDNVKDFGKVFPDINSILGHVNQLFHMFDALQEPGTIAPGIGVRQWHIDAHARNILASTDGKLSLIDFSIVTQCCDDPHKCTVDSEFGDVEMKPCWTLPRRKEFNFDRGSSYMVEYMLSVALREEFGMWSAWFKGLHNTSLESLVMELRSSSGPSHEMYRNQWGPQNAEVILVMAGTRHKKDLQWPPPFMEPVKIALESDPLRPLEL